MSVIKNNYRLLSLFKTQIIHCFYLFLLIILCDVNAPLYAEVYKWTDPETGIVSYSSKPKAKDAVLANLPPLLREKQDVKTLKNKAENTENRTELQKTQLKSCGSHGGINCQAGADSDGSVICYDGFKEASARFRFSCSNSKLTITEVSETKDDGSFQVTVRNESSVKALGSKVLLTSVEGTSIKGSGPNDIESHALAEYTFHTNLPAGKKPSPTQFVAKCDNCSFQ
jgi:hypothetical protein